ncbi:MAG: hypothetical protein A2381_19950 [Bdellovibrionales bacterium RIFOXYB1_FULL_37_110]|nr:MAG: hypothetical protein A2181_03585 [Bdellovibrionales bacterium RIFOXYA1_FULL_38_20]OFZ51011.1 MAG: hypothetical protein A2417_19735 [Bdellovibrionales bacterium RIFOXYC1_FULL_37_79]OFZ60223.1 MAG: hypothetical protein A2381_19950 [Bdellovibrionales bacterium RIFOXYB1_FULL_37_110]OFZ61585.1 MAG: hypothetical protein A2577_10390 [Bdellovibrionales bacterium RIFOXYD1_FULL_36_51]
MQYTLLSLVMLALFSSCGDLSNQGDPNEACDGKDYCHIFISSSTTKGNLAASGSGIDEADAICTASKPANTGTVKAFLSDGTNRVACTSADCSGGIGEHIDWVLAANREYRRPGGAVVIGTTDAFGIFGFPLLSEFYSSAGTIFTGMTTDYRPANDCTNWTSTLGTGTNGVLDSKLSNALSSADNSCNNTHHILCVEQ